jgi:hypothetical protein
MPFPLSRCRRVIPFGKPEKNDVKSGGRALINVTLQ